MSTLHIVSNNLSASIWDDLRHSLNPGDAILLSCDGVYLGVQQKPIEHVALYALSIDIEARGLSALVHPAIELIDHSHMVVLTLKHDKSLSWS